MHRKLRIARCRHAADARIVPDVGPISPFISEPGNIASDRNIIWRIRKNEICRPAIEELIANGRVERIAANEPMPAEEPDIAWARNRAERRRKGCAAKPYLNHLTEVAELVALATGGTNPGPITAAILHDVVEDTSATRSEVEHYLGLMSPALLPR